MPTSGTCLICHGPSPDDPCCSVACFHAARLERDRNLRQLRTLPATPEVDELRSRLRHRNGALTSALMRGAHLARAAADQRSGEVSNA